MSSRSAPGSRDPLTIQRLEAAIVAMAYIVVRHGSRYAPLLEKLEDEAVRMRARVDPVERARQLLARYTNDGGTNAIR